MRPRQAGFADLAYQAEMLLDAARVEAYARAIALTVRPEDVVVDVGAGTGILAALAAKAGARRIFAVEQGPMAELAERVVEANGVADRVEVIRADARDLDYPEPPTLIVTETLGPAGIDEDICALVSAVAERCAPAVRCLPSSLRVCVGLFADAALASGLSSLTDVCGLDLSPVRERLANRVVQARLASADHLTAPAASPWLDLPGAVAPQELELTLTATAPGQASALGAWFEARLAPDRLLSTAPDASPTHWAQLCFPLDPPLPLDPSRPIALTLTPRYLHHRALWSWSLTTGPHRRAGDHLHSTSGSRPDLPRTL